MIDSHCHLEQPEFSKDRDEVIERCKKELKAIITCCAHPDDFDITMEMVKKHKGFVFASAGIHPEYIKEVTEKEKDEFLDKIKENKNEIVAIGEIGLDFFWIKEKYWQEKQRELFKELINFAKWLKKPIVVHARDAFEESLRILEGEDAKRVLMHLFGAKHIIKRIEENGYYISIGPIILRSKVHKKIARDFSLEKILLETDSPWFGFGKRNEPTSIKDVAKKISEIKKSDFDDIWKQCGKNAINFFNLQIKI